MRKCATTSGWMSFFYSLESGLKLKDMFGENETMQMHELSWALFANDAMFFVYLCIHYVVVF